MPRQTREQARPDNPEPPVARQPVALPLVDEQPVETQRVETQRVERQPVAELLNDPTAGPADDLPDNAEREAVSGSEGDAGGVMSSGTGWPGSPDAYGEELAQLIASAPPPSARVRALLRGYLPPPAPAADGLSGRRRSKRQPE